MINAFLIARQRMEESDISYWNCHKGFRERLAWDLVEEGFRQLNPTRIQRLQTIPSVALPMPNGRNCPGSTPAGNNSLSRAQGYITKCTPLPPMRKDPVLHQLARNKLKVSPQYCVLCRFLSKAPQGTPQYDAFTLAQNGPKGRIRRTLFVCDYCDISGFKVSLCKDFCFDFFHSASFH